MLAGFVFGSILAAGAVAAQTPQVLSGDGSFSVEPPAGWKAVSVPDADALEIRNPDRLTLLLMRETQSEPSAGSAALRKRLRGAGSAMLQRVTPGGRTVHYVMSRLRDKRIRLQGWLECGSWRFEYEAIALGLDEPFPLLDTLKCGAPPAQPGYPLGSTGWQLAPPPGLRMSVRAGAGWAPWPALADPPGGAPPQPPHWVRVSRTPLPGAPNGFIVDEEDLSFAEGSEQWSPGASWAFGCGGLPPLEPPVQLVHKGETAFRYACPIKGSNDVRLFFDVIYDYDRDVTNARYVRLVFDRRRRFDGSCASPGCMDVRSRAPDAGLFRRAAEGLGPAGPPAAETPPAQPAGVPLLR